MLVVNFVQGADKILIINVDKTETTVALFSPGSEPQTKTIPTNDFFPVNPAAAQGGEAGMGQLLQQMVFIVDKYQAAGFSLKSVTLDNISPEMIAMLKMAAPFLSGGGAGGLGSLMSQFGGGLPRG